MDESVEVGYDARAVANAILDYCDAHSIRITHLALQKVMYFCHAWFLVRADAPLVRQKFEAWQHGPVLQCLYQELKSAGAKPITNRLMSLNRATGNRTKATAIFSDQSRACFEEALAFYARLPATELVDLSHEPGGPWDAVRNHTDRTNPGMYIENARIKDHYAKEWAISRKH